MISVKILLASFIACVFGGPNADKDRVPSLPEIGEITGFDYYSGYLPVSSTKELHYVFVTSQDDPVNDPVIIWLNGGPGCSSLAGLLMETGPFVIDDGSPVIFANPYSWNTFANVLFLEMPGGVGFSTCGNALDCTYNDDTTAEQNMIALKYFYEELFQEFVPNELYIAGESYAGIYVPYLLDQVHLYNKDPTTSTILNLKGMAVGNGITNYEFDNQVAYFEAVYWHGIISDTIRDGLLSNGCYDEFGGDQPLSAICAELLVKVEVLAANTNVYDLYGYCWQPEDQLLSMYGDGVSQVDDKFFRKEVMLMSDYTPWLFETKIPGKKKLMELPPCAYGQPVIDYYRRSDVRTALHIPSDIPEWDFCTSSITYHKQDIGSQWVYQKYNGQYRMLKYSGDTDGAVPIYGTLGWIDQMVKKLRLEITTLWYPYYYVDEIAGAQVAGFLEQYEGDFSFATVHGSGHNVPSMKRLQAYQLFSNWFKGVQPPGRGQV